jgi:hypothetical protein
VVLEPIRVVNRGIGSSIDRFGWSLEMAGSEVYRIGLLACRVEVSSVF